MLGDRKACPYIVQSFFRLPRLNFMPLLQTLNLQQQLWENRLRDEQTSKLKDVLRYEPIHNVE